MPVDQPITPKPKLLWYRPTPGRLLVVLLAVEGGLLLSERWFPKGWAVLIAVASVGVFLLLMLLWLAVALLFRRRFQFSIRSIMVLTVAVAVPFSWLAVAMKWAKKQREAVDAIKEIGGFVIYYGIYYENPRPVFCQEWLQNALGDDFFRTVHGVVLIGTEATDADLMYVERFTCLKEIFLDATIITDAGLTHIVELTQLEHIYLTNTNITDVGLEHLKKLNELIYLSIEETKVTDAGVAKLQKALPGCKIVR